MGEEYGLLSRALVSFDAVLLGAIIEGLQTHPTAASRCRCPINPTVFRPTLHHDSVTMRFSAAAQVLLADQWIADKAMDGAVLAQIARPATGPMVRVAEQTLDEMGARTSSLHNFAQRQVAVEAETPDPWQAARPTADALHALFSWIPELPGVVALDAVQRTRLAEMGSAIGRLVYGVDALEDLADDQKSGAFNPCLVGGQPDRRRLASCEQMIADALDQIQTCLAVLPWRRNEELLVNILVERQARKARDARANVQVPSPPWWIALWTWLITAFSKPFARLFSQPFSTPFNQLVGRPVVSDASDRGLGDDEGEEENPKRKRKVRRRRRKKKKNSGDDGFDSDDGGWWWCCELAECGTGCDCGRRDNECCDVRICGPCEMDCCPCDSDGCGLECDGCCCG